MIRALSALVFLLAAAGAGDDLPALGEHAERGTVASERPLAGPWGHEPAAFRFALAPIRVLGPTTVHHLVYPSPGPSRFRENMTVHAEYYLPKGAGPFPAAIVLHVLDGDFVAARLIATALAQRGTAALLVKLPYYGERRPAVVNASDLTLTDVRHAVLQTVRDIRRGAAWLRARKEVDGRKVGIVGVSLGSFAAQLAAGVDRTFDRCAFILGGASIVDAVYSETRDARKVRSWMDSRGWTREEMRRLFAGLEPIDVAKGIRRETVLMINCRGDRVVRAESVKRYWEAIGKPEILWYEGDHRALRKRVLPILGRLTAHFAR